MTRSRIGPLALEAPLGERGSHVFRAIHMQQKVQVAVRVFTITMGMTPEAKQEFANQLDGLKTLRHPGIVRCYGGGFDAKDAYLVYELFDSESLHAQLERKDRLPWESVLQYGLQLCEALSYAHEAGWTHGRIRPDKILVSPDGTSVKLCDFRRGPGTPAPRTPSQLTYCAPESLPNPETSDVAGDLYSVGAVMYHAITGQPPFVGENGAAIKESILESVAPAVASIVYDCPVWLSAIVEQLLLKDPLRRPYTAAATAMALREAQKRATDGIGVAQHAMSGFSPLQMNVDRDEAAKALGRKKKKKRRAVDEDGVELHSPTLFERPSVLLGILVVTIGIITVLVWPASERTLRLRAESLLQRDDGIARNDARDRYLLPMLERFPNGEHAAWAQEELEKIEMFNAEDRMRRNQRMRIPPTTEGERKYMEAQNFEIFGDRLTALNMYHGIVDLLKDQPESRPFVNLARRRIESIESNPPNIDELRRFLREKLDQADKMYQEGDVIRAKQIWDGIISLYNGNREMIKFVEQAQGRIEKLKSS